MTISTQSHAEFRSRLAALLARHRTPLSGTFELTPRCNFACGHCYLQDRRSDSPQLSTAVISDILAQLADAGCLAIAFTGGEALLRDDYFEIHRRAHGLGFWISLFTNGVLIDAAVADQLAAHPPYVVEISLYGGDEETVRLVTGRSGAFEKVANAVDLLLARGIRIILKSVLLAPIVARFDRLEAFAQARGLSLVTDPGVSPTIDGNRAPVALRGVPEAAVEIEFSAEGSRRQLTQYHHRIQASGPADGEPSCGAGFSGFHIDYNGNLMSCLMLREPSFNLNQMRFAEAWERLGELARPVYPAGTECRSCDIKHLCGFCPGALYCGETPPDGPEGKNSFYCQVGRARLGKLISEEKR